MAGIDWAIVAVVLLSVVLAAAKGFFYELFVLAGVVLGYLLAVWEYWRIAARIAPYVREPWLADIAGFFAIFFAVLLIAGIAGSLARWAMGKAGLRGLDRLLGAAFGLVRGLVIISVMVLALATFAPGSRMLAHSSLTGYFLVSARAMSWLAPAGLRERFRQGRALLREAARTAQPAPAGRSSSATNNQ